ncbi:hypothetical protein [Azospirillum sp. TSO22-1]|uniref:hypothetical protein n=1 Tax=Azospirillum sp. TSO22-1 TaxID=716789 RepID=UPI000D622C04|nr:hypothetical protein [Azospirillum sp. TSO22-1]PWC34859.1 hypothetical protein TSO221_30945 [Azospirillum sp. TSO22-1]
MDFSALMRVANPPQNSFTREVVCEYLADRDFNVFHEREWERVFGIQAAYSDAPDYWLDHSARHKVRAG